MPSTYLLQQMVCEDPKERFVKTGWGKSIEELEELLSLETLATIEQERPGKIRRYIENQLAYVPTDQDQRYVMARTLYNDTKDLPRAHDALRVILYHL